MKKLILYATGGLCNRIFPLASFVEYAHLTNRELFIYWPSDNACEANFNDLYDDSFNFVDDNFLTLLRDVECHSRFLESVHNDNYMYDRSFLWNQLQRGTIKIDKQIQLDNPSENLLICTNTYLRSVDRLKCDMILKGFQIRQKFIERADDLADRLKVDKTVVGAHVRGTDFGLNINFWSNEIMKYGDRKVFISSDDKDLEETLSMKFNLIRRKDKHYITKVNCNLPWRLPNQRVCNTFMNLESMKDAMVDILLLEKTDFRIFKPTSTFSNYIQVRIRL